jgi:hypothetical protein
MPHLLVGRVGFSAPPAILLFLLDFLELTEILVGGRLFDMPQFGAYL